jgi:intracellular multiplication protein IcmE
VIPTPIDPATTKLEVPEEEKVQEDPLERGRRIQEERRRQQGAPPAQPVVTNPHADAIDALANAMAQQMQGILESRKAIEPETINVADEEWLKGKRREEEEERMRRARENAEAGGGGVTADGEIVDILIPAGTIEYAQLLIEANSDVDDGPVLAHLVSGPLAGSKMLGSFDVEDNYLVLSFDVLVIDGISHRLDAIALVPDTTLPAVATEVDQRYFSRVLLPAASEFIEGFAEAVAQTSTTVVVTDGAAVQDTQELDTREEFFKGFEAAAEKVSEIIDEDADDIEPLIKVEAGTALGILFVEPVTEKTS